MKLRILILLIFGITNYGFGQNLNMIIDVNNELVTSEISGAYLNFENKNGTKERIQIGYHPGELILEQNSWNKINSEETTKITLSFNYYTWKRNNQENATFEVEMKKYHFDMQYLILHVYDFRERKYRKKYGCLTDKEYITDFNYPQGGILISCK
ncbi:hypothetical protein BH23BAC2_BH23BAC2_18290 [soil metagenome]